MCMQTLYGSKVEIPNNLQHPQWSVGAKWYDVDSDYTVLV